MHLYRGKCFRKHNFDIYLKANHYFYIGRYVVTCHNMTNDKKFPSYAFVCISNEIWTLGHNSDFLFSEKLYTSS